MTLIAAENRELALSISINQRNPKPEPEGPGTGYYLALTFGTLLSSQRADAQKLDPHGNRPWLDVQHYAGFQQLPTRGAGPADLPARAAHGEQYTTLRGRARGVPYPVPGCPEPADSGEDGALSQRPRKLSIPTVRPGREPISRTARSTPGMNDARS
jgi:hypothetical protein